MDVLKNSQFLKLWGNQILLQISFNTCNFTALLLINNLTSSRIALAQFYAAIVLPAFLVGVFAGPVVDMVNRKKLMLITNLLLTALFLLYSFVPNSYLALLMIAFLSAGVAQFFTPAEAATIPLIVEEKQLEEANALFLFTALGSALVGYSLAGPLVDLFGGLNSHGAIMVFRIASLLTFLGFALRFSLETIENIKPEFKSEQLLNRTYLLMKEVLSHTKKDINLWLPLLLLTLVEFNIGMLTIIFLDFVQKYLSLSPTSVSYLLILPTIAGLIVGVLIMQKAHWKKTRAIFLASFFFGLIIFLLGIFAKVLGFTSLRIFTLTSAFFIGTTVVFIAVHSRTILQEHTPDFMLGRVFSLITIASSAIIPIPILLVALITEKIAASTIFILYGLIMMLVGIMLGPFLKRLN